MACLSILGSLLLLVSQPLSQDTAFEFRDSLRVSGAPLRALHRRRRLLRRGSQLRDCGGVALSRLQACPAPLRPRLLGAAPKAPR